MPRSAKRKYNVKTIMKENLDYFVKLDEIYNCVKKKRYVIIIPTIVLDF